MMSKFGPQVRLEEMTREDFANMQGKAVWVSVADVNEETGVTSKVRADVVGRVSVISRVEDLWDDDTYKFDIGFTVQKMTPSPRHCRTPRVVPS